MIEVRRKNAGHTYLFRYSDESVPELFAKFGTFATRDDLNFTWWDAGQLIHDVVTEKRKRNKRIKETRHGGR